MKPTELIGYAGYVVGALIIIFSKVKNDNLADLKQRVEILEKELVYSKDLLDKERKQAQAQHLANRESITELKTQVKLYKDLQLDSIAKTNQEMLEALKASAMIRATEKDEGVLVHTEAANPLSVKVKE